MGAVSKTQLISPQERAKQAEFVKQLREKQQVQQAGEKNPQAAQVDTQNYQLGALGSLQPTQQVGFVPTVEAPKLPERPVFATVQGIGGEQIVDGNQGKGLGRVLAQGNVDANGVHRGINDTNYTTGLGHDKYTMWYAA